MLGNPSRPSTPRHDEQGPAHPDLVDHVLNAAGGLDRWRQLSALHLDLHIGGSMWGRRGQPDVLNDVTATVGTTLQLVQYKPFSGPHLRSYYQPSLVAINDANGGIVSQRDEPRAILLARDPAERWDLLDVAYFAGYALWNYLNMPWLLAGPDVTATEIEPWTETSPFTDGLPEQWRRLAVTFPDRIATHNSHQVFYYDAAGRQRRHDYAADVFAGTPTAQYSDRHRDFGGIVIPTRRRVLPRAPDNTTTDAPVLVSIDIDNIRLDDSQPSR